MKVFKKVIPLVVIGLFITSLTWAASGDKLSFQAEPGTTESGYTIGADIYRIDAAGRLVEAANETTMGYIALPLTSFTNEGSAITISPEGANYISPPEARGLLVNGNPVIRLDNGVNNTSEWIESSFRVPDDYYQNGDFRVKTISNENNYAAKLEFAVRRHTNTTVDTTDSTGETAVALPVSPGASTVAELELNPVSDFDSLSAGNWVTIKVRRNLKNNGAYADEPLDIYNFVFRYEKQY